MAEKTVVNILHVTLYLQMGGLETVIMDLCRHTDHKAYNVHVLCLKGYDESYRKRLKEYGVQFHHIVRKNRYDISFFKRIVVLLKKLEIDVIHAHTGSVFNAFLCGRLAGISAQIFTEHGLPIYADGRLIEVNFQTRLEDKFIGWQARKMIPVSEEIADSLRRRYPGQRDKVELIPNGINTVTFSPENRDKQNLNIPKSKFILGTVGRLVAIKNHSLLINVFARLVKERGDNFHLILVGNGTERKALELQTQELDISKEVSFLGVRTDIHEILPAMDVFVLPSLTEGTSISLLEALACGVPVLASNVGGNPALVEDEGNGFLFEVNDSDMLFDRLVRLYENESLRFTMSKKARESVVGKYDAVSMTSNYEKMYGQIVE